MVAMSGGTLAARAEGLWARLSRNESARGLALVSPTFLYALLLLVAPILVIIAFSFWTQDYLTIDRTATLANYREAWSDPLYRTLMFRSLGVSAVVTAITVLLAYPMAYYLSFHGGQRKALWLFLITIPFWTSYLLRVFAWKIILGYNGVVNASLMELGILAQPMEFLLYNVNAVVITLAHAWAPFAILPIFVSLEKIDRSLLEAATDLGDGPLRRFLRITLPLSLPGVVAAALIVFIPTVGDYVTPRLVGGKDGLMIANMIQVQFGKANDWPLGAALAVSTMVIVTAASLAFALLVRQLGTRFR
ncbi:ABC transporter permease [Pelagibius sp. 7325]|uniref:ABC transporter permease n=1 Tax=Pelagibius sp. 7325 TaxID=3131994 RepID=UPI0030EF4AE5